MSKEYDVSVYPADRLLWVADIYYPNRPRTRIFRFTKNQAVRAAKRQVKRYKALDKQAVEFEL